MYDIVFIGHCFILYIASHCDLSKARRRPAARETATHSTQGERDSLRVRPAAAGERARFTLGATPGSGGGLAPHLCVCVWAQWAGQILRCWATGPPRLRPARGVTSLSHVTAACRDTVGPWSRDRACAGPGRAGARAGVRAGPVRASARGGRVPGRVGRVRAGAVAAV